MTMLMDNGREHSSKEHVQHLFNKNAELENKRRKAAQARIPSDPNTWQTMRENYEAIVLEDHDFSEQHDVEYALWQLHYRRIDELRALYNAALSSAASTAPQNGKGPVRGGPDRLTKLRSQFKTFLSEATGFYHDLMLKIRAKYGLPLGYTSDDLDTQIPTAKDGSKSSEVKKGLLSCHRCLIYLGDLSRYKGLYGEGSSKAQDFAAASGYYMQASSLWPSSGNPHHQLAILSGYSNDELLSIYRYFRSLAVETPFTTARDNLIIAFEKNRQGYCLLLGDAKTTKVKTTPPRVPGKARNRGETRPPLKENKVKAIAVKERAPTNFDLFKAFITRFIRLNGILFTRTSLETFTEVLSVVKNDLIELLSSGPNEELNFGLDAAESGLSIVRMVAILIFSVNNVSKENENQSYADILQRSVLLQNACTATFEFMGCVLERCDQLKDPSSSYLLPGIMVFVEWLACCQDVAAGSDMEEKERNAISFFWNKCVSFLNKLLSSGHAYITEDEDETFSSNMSKYDENETADLLALPEDIELRGFLPLVPAQLILDFSRKHSVGHGGDDKEKIARVHRIVAAGKALVNNVQVGEEGIYFDSKLKKFFFGIKPQNFDDSILSHHWEPNLIGNLPDISVGAHMALSADSKEDAVDAEDEDDDEVIVFKPSINEMYVDEFSSKTASSEVLTSVGGPGNIHLGNENGVSNVAQESSLQPAAASACIKPEVTAANGVAHSGSQYILPGQHSIGKWPVEHVPLLDGLAQLNLRENSSVKAELQDKFGVPQPAALSMPYSHFVEDGANHNYPIKVPQSRFDLVMPSGPSADTLPVKPSSVGPPSLKKNPVSRPFRNIGPPPGFGSVPSKIVDESLHNSVMKNEIPPIPKLDDYSWLDGHQIISSNQNVGFSNSLSHVGPTFPSKINGNISMGISAFPFPGKQVSPLQVPSDNQKSWMDYQLLEQVKQHEQQQFQKVHQQPVGPPQQYPTKSLWNGHFYV